MKHRLFWQFLFIFLLLLVWNGIHYFYQFQKNTYQSSIGALPLLLFSNSAAAFDSLSFELEEKPYVERMELENKEEIAELLIREYELSDAEAILQSHTLPFVLKIYFQGEDFTIAAKKELKSILEKFSSVVHWKFNDSYWLHFQHRILLLNRLYLYSTLSIAAILFVFATYFRIRSEIKQDYFWNVFLAAGGAYSKRRISFLWQSLVLIFVPVLLNYGIYFYLKRSSFLRFDIDFIYFGYEAVLLVLVSIFAGLFLGKRL